MLVILLGLFIGVVAGAVQFFLLFKFVRNVTGGKMGSKTLLFAVTQFFFPFTILVICAFLLPESLMWVGIAMASSLIICSVIKFILTARQKD